MNERRDLQGDVYYVPPQNEQDGPDVGARFSDYAFRVIVLSGTVIMTQSFETAAGLSLFGGNFGDDGSPDNSQTYWGNLLDDDPAFKYVSRTQFVLRGLPAVSANLPKLEQAVLGDLQWFVTKRIANTLDVFVSLQGRDRVNMRITIEAQGEISQFTFTENWPVPGLEVF